MNRDQLYLLKPNFLENGKGTYFCPGCAEMTGLLEYYTDLKKKLDVHIIDFPRTRPELAPLLGEENQGCPVLVLGTVLPYLPPCLKVQRANEHAFVDGAREIAEYLAHVHGIGIPH